MLEHIAAYCPFACAVDFAYCARMKMELNFQDGQDGCFSQATAVQQPPSLLISLCHSTASSAYELFLLLQTTEAEVFTLLLFVYFPCNKL